MTWAGEPIVAPALALFGAVACAPPPRLAAPAARIHDIEAERTEVDAAPTAAREGGGGGRPGGADRGETTPDAHWCADDGWITLDETTCVFVPHPKPDRLVFFAHGMLAPGQSPARQQRVVRRAAQALRFVAVFPHGAPGLCGLSRTYDEWLCWPTTAASFEREAPAILERWAHTQTAIEDLLEVRFSERFLVGFSNGGYFAAYVATQGLGRFDGFAVLGAGRTDFDERPMAARGAPVSIVVGDLEVRSTRRAAEQLAEELERRDWPHELVRVPRRGHLLVVEDFARSFRVWNAR